MLVGKEGEVLRRAGWVLLLTATALHVTAAAHAQSSLGIGANEAVAPSTGLFAHWMNWINGRQQEFYRALTGSLKAMRDDRGQLWLMVGLSFAYGMFHAAGPGHGKAVISSYILANEVALRRGVLLSFVSAFLQAAMAILLMAAVYLLLRGTAVNMTNATHFLEVASYALITAFGAWLLWKKAGPHMANLFRGRPAASLSAAAVGLNFDAGRGHVHGPGCNHGSFAYGKGTASARFAAEPVVCTDCGHAHAPDPAMLGGDAFDWRTAWSAVAAVGLRPGTVALIVLSFSFLNGLWLGGVISVLAMALGTAITVSLLATLAVLAKNWALAFAGNGRAGNRLHAAIEIGGTALVFLLGLALLVASLAA